MYEEVEQRGGLPKTPVVQNDVFPLVLMTKLVYWEPAIVDLPKRSIVLRGSLQCANRIDHRCVTSTRL